SYDLGKQDNEKVAPLNPLIDFGDPIRSHPHADVDKNLVTASDKSVTQGVRELLVGRNAAFVGNKELGPRHSHLNIGPVAANTLKKCNLIATILHPNTIFAQGPLWTLNLPSTI